MDIYEGKHLCIVGANGTGKTSIVRVLCELWPLREGTITWKTPRPHLIVIPQRPFMPPSTLAELIAWPDFPQFDLAMFDCIMDRVGLSGLVSRVNGYHKHFSRWCDMLSPGEQQRIAFARTLYHLQKPTHGGDTIDLSQSDEATQPLLYDRTDNPSDVLVVLDEADAALDPAAARALIETLSPLATLVVITHRLGTVPNASVLNLTGEGRWELSSE